MMDPSNPNARERREAKPCEQFAERMYLLAAVELEQTEAIEAETHAAQCQECGAFLLQNQQMMEMLAAAPRARAQRRSSRRMPSRPHQRTR